MLVQDQFGQQTLRVVRSGQMLCVPSEKDGVASSLGIDHYKCYGARTKRGTPAFTRLDVNLRDQYQTRLTQLAESVRTVVEHGDQRREGRERLVAADVRRRFVATDVLFTGL